MASGSGSDGEMDSTTKTRIVNNTGSNWIDVEGQNLTGTIGATQSEINSIPGSSQFLQCQAGVP